MTLDELRGMAANGSVTPFDQIRSTEQTEWQEAGTLQIFEETSSKARPPNDPAVVRPKGPLPVPTGRSSRLPELLKSVPLLAWAGTAVVGLMLVVLVLFVAFGGDGTEDGQGSPGDGRPAVAITTPRKSPTKPVEPTAAVDETPLSIADVTKLVDPSVVTIIVEGIGQGSGFVVDADGTIVTNYHVIEGAKKAKVIFRDGLTADVLGFSAFSIGKDLAVLHVAAPGSELRPLELAAEIPIKGSTVLAFGSPRGFASSVSDGIVSAIRPGSEVRRMLPTDLYVKLGFDRDATWIQTTAPISHGNSGGPLVDQAGKVVGVNTWSPGGQNLNFAIATRHVREVLSRRGRVQVLARLPRPRKVERAFAHANRGYAHAMKGEHVKAIIAYTEAIRLSPDYAYAYCGRGVGYVRLREYIKGIADFNIAIRLKPDYAEAHFQRGHAYEEIGEYAKSISDYTEAIRLDPDDAVGYSNRGLTYQGQQEYVKAIADYTEAIRLDPDYAKAYFGRGWAHFYNGEHARAIADCTVAIRLKPDFSGAYFIRGKAYQRIGDRDQGNADLAKAKVFGFRVRRRDFQGR